MTAKHIVLSVFSVFLLMFSVFAAITYQKGYYDFTFIERPGQKIPEKTYSNYRPDPQQYQAVPETEDVSGSSLPESEYIPPADEPEIRKTYREVVGSFPTVSELRNEGYRLSDAIYSGRHRLALLETPNITTEFSNCDEILDIPEKRPNFVGGYTTFLVKTQIAKPAIKLYDGLIYYDDALNGHVLCDSYFNGIYRRFDCREFVPVYCRDFGDPIFYAKGEYYYLDLEGTSPSFSEVFDSSGIETKLKADVPEYYFPSPTDLVPYHDDETDLWGYRNEMDEVVIEPKFFSAYEFNDNGLAACVDQANKLIFINKKGEIKISRYEKLFYKNQRKGVIYYSPPDTYGLESLGMFYFDHGLVRVRVQVHDDEKGDKFIIDDYSVLLNSAGYEYKDIPVGFNIESYSDGIILLEKNGLYGYYDLDQKWIAQPKYTYATPFVEGVAVIGGEDGKRALIDTNGNILLDFVFDYISMPSRGVIAAYEIDNGWKIFHKMA